MQIANLHLPVCNLQWLAIAIHLPSPASPYGRSIPFSSNSTATRMIAAAVL
jgi:hypothetical protein